MDYKIFFTTDNKSGWKTRESLLKKNEPKIYDELKLFINKNNLSELPFKQQVWHFINNDVDIKKCLGCGGDVEFRGTLLKGYRDFCSLPCANSSGLLEKRASEAIKIKYGVDSFPQHESFVKKVKATKLAKYGNENYNNISQTLITKEILYGDKNYSNLDKNAITTRENLLLRLQSKTLDELLNYGINDKHITLLCSSCKMEYDIYQGLFKYRCSVNVKPCTICNPIRETNSIQEKELFEFVKGILPNEIVNNKDRSIISNIKPLELDIYIPSRNIAIEYNGLYWHSDKFESDSHLKDKTVKCEEKGVDLIHVFEDEWIFKKDIVKSVINSKLGLFDNVIFGRKCIIKEVSPKESKKFLDNNHLQGSIPSKIKLGLYYNDELVSLMTFGSLRKAMGSKSVDGSFELYRFANKLNTSVLGSFSKLLKYFITTYNPNSILTFSDNRYFSGEVYKKNGFEFIHNSRPNYFYLINHKREYRFKYRKDILIKEGYDASKTEREIMKERGINRIYDCGNKKWLLKIK